MIRFIQRHPFVSFALALAAILTIGHFYDQSVTDRLRASAITQCHRVNALRVRVNVGAYVTWLDNQATILRDGNLASAGQLQLDTHTSPNKMVTRKAIVAHRLAVSAAIASAARLTYTFPTDCWAAIENPGSYHEPHPVKFNDGLFVPPASS